jgi:hypothetical protein
MNKDIRLIVAGGFAVLAGALCAASSGGEQGRAPKFSHPQQITNPYLPLMNLKQDILEGKEDGISVRIERSAMPGKHKSFKIGDQTVEAAVFEDREFGNGKLKEVTLDYFAQDDDGMVYYLGEDVEDYTDGKVTGHSGAWLMGEQTSHPGILLPAHPGMGDKFRSEDVPNITTEDDEVVSVSETVKVPAGTYKNCLKVKEVADGEVEYKYYAPGVGCVKEVPGKGEVVLKSHTTSP